MRVVATTTGSFDTTKDTGPSEACAGTQLPKLSVEHVQRIVFEEEAPANATTLGGTFRRCSFGRTRLNKSNSLVADTVHLPCHGTSWYGTNWTAQSCTFNDYNGLADAADEVLIARGVPFHKYFYRLYLLPPGPCSFVGIAYMGCVSTFDCRGWIGGEFWGSAQAMAHELGHMLYNAHAGAVTPDGTVDPYGDRSDVMGFLIPDNDRCWNTPHAWQMGWITVQLLERLSEGEAQTISLASQALSNKSGLRIVPSWNEADPLFLGFRTPHGPDATLPEDVANKVGVYTSPISHTFDLRPTTLHALLGPGQSWEYTDLVVTFARTTNITMVPDTTTAVVNVPAAVVTVCRRGGPRETAASCKAGLDWDCNGLAGPLDPACQRPIQRLVRRPPRRLFLRKQSN